MSPRADAEGGMAPRRGLLQRLLDSFTGLVARVQFPGSGGYWDARYRFRGSSGAGSYGASARSKAAYVNRFVAGHDVSSVVDFGCGDGAQLTLLDLPEYLGVDVSPTAVRRCQSSFAGDLGKQFVSLADYTGQQADMAMSLDVTYHLVEDAVFDDYMARLFAAARRYVLIYSTNFEQPSPWGSAHVRHRDLASYCRLKFPEFTLVDEPDSVAGVTSTIPRFLAYRRIAGQATK